MRIDTAEPDEVRSITPNGMPNKVYAPAMLIVGIGGYLLFGPLGLIVGEAVLLLVAFVMAASSSVYTVKYTDGDEEIVRSGIVPPERIQELQEHVRKRHMRF